MSWLCNNGNNRQIFHTQEIFTDCFAAPSLREPVVPIETCLLHHQQLVNKGAFASDFVWFDPEFPTAMFHQSDCL